MNKTAARRPVSERATLEAFRQDGFVVVPGLFDEEEPRRISAWTDELQGQPEVPGRCMMYFERSLLRPGERVLQRIENFCPFHAGFAVLCDGDKLRGFADQRGPARHPGAAAAPTAPAASVARSLRAARRRALLQQVVVEGGQRFQHRRRGARERRPVHDGQGPG